MRCNVGGIERPTRILFGVLILAIAAFLYLPPVATAIAFGVGFIALVTGAIGFCPLWAVFGVNTCPTRLSQKGERRT